MKTSNKILLIFFITATVLMTVVHLTIYAKYKRGDYVSFEKIREGRFDEYELPKVKYVSITGMQRCNILPAAEPKIKIFKLKGTRLSYKVVNDTLVILGDSLLSRQDYEQKTRNNQTINLYLPGVEEISAFYSGLFLNGGADTTSAPSWLVHLYNRSNLTTGDFNYKKAFFNRLQVNANTSEANFNEETVINDLAIQATASSIITNRRGDIKHLQMNIDNSSTIVLRGKGVSDIKSVSKE